MRKLLLTTAAAIILAGPALADTKMLVAKLSAVVKAGPQGQSTIIRSAGVVNFIAIGNRVDAYDPTTNTVIPSLTVTVPLGTIIDMVFESPFLTVQGGGPFAVTISYATVPPTIFPAVAL